MNDFFQDVDRQKEKGRGSACTWWSLGILVIATIILGAILIGRIFW